MKSMKNCKITLLLVVLFCTFKSYSCDRTSISVTNLVYDGTYYTYTADVCIGISPNWGETNSFCIVTTGGTITGSGPYTSSFTSSYNYCSTTLSFNGQGCAVTAMGAAPAGGTVQTANVSVSGNVSGGDLCFSGGGGNAIGPDDLVADCADCGNPSQLCWTVQFSTTTPISAVQLEGAEGGAATCPDEIDVSLPPAPPSCTPPAVSATVNGASSITVCEGQTINLSGNCTSNCDPDKADNIWSGPGGYSYTAMGGGGATFPLATSTTVTSSGTYTFQNGSGSCFATATVDVIVIPAPTAALNVAEVNDCNSADVQVTFTGTGPWTFSYDDGSGSTSVTTSSNPYTISGLTSSTTVSLGAGVTSGACGPTLVGSTSGTTDVLISPVTAEAGDYWEVLVGVDEPLDGTGTPGLVGYDTVISPTTVSSSGCSGDCQFNDGDTGDEAISNGISLSSLGLTCVGGTIGIDNIPDNSICVEYSGSKSGDIEADLCFGGTCVLIPAGSFGASPYCFDRGTVFNLLSGASCSSNDDIFVKLTDTRMVGSMASHGMLAGISVTLNDIELTEKDNPTYSWAAASGDANVGDLTCTDCADPVFNSDVFGSGCFELTVTDGFGCSTTDQVCYNTILSNNEFSLNALIVNNKVVLSWNLDEHYQSFVIEKSVDGLDFQELGLVDNNENLFSFNFVDDYFEKEAYYRIKAIKKDNHIEYSGVKFVSEETDGLVRIEKIYPQPLLDVLKIETISGAESELSCKVIDLTGRQVFENNFVLLKGNMTSSVDLSNLNSGTYLLKLNTKDKQFTTKIVKE